MTTRYISSACNTYPHCVDWGNNGLICFGACNAVAIYEPCTHIGRVTHTLHRHRDHVKSVRWIRPGDGGPESEFLSSSADGRVIIWSKNGTDDTFRDTTTVDMGSNVYFADCLQLSDVALATSNFPQLLICAGSLDSEIKVWLREEDGSVKTVQSIFFQPNLIIHGRLAYLPTTKRPLLAVALSDCSILLYTRDSDVPESNFVKVQCLTGHKNWVQSMEFAYNDDGNSLLATGSQDRTIRLWKIGKAVAKEPSDLFQPKRYIFTVDGEEYDISLESILYGHEDRIYGVHWQPVKAEDDKDGQTMRLLSSSTDKSMVIWEPDESTGIWVEKVRVGNVGGNSLGFYGCKFGPDGLHILGHGQHEGSFHIWRYSQEIANWIPRSAPSGHCSKVVDLCWEPKGRFLLTASTDQSTRIYAPWKNDSQELWHEIARPQLHGYDMACLVTLAPYMYASGAEEKVVRIFKATSAFRDRLRLLASVDDFEITMAHGATVPSLGLMNKATLDEEVDQCKSEEENSTSGTYEPPVEDELAQSTLWPELQKLYGHGYEIFCMAARHDGQLLATACRSTSEEHSAILLWSTDTWSQVQRLVSHQLTVTQLAFSPNDKYLLSVSRDRRWSLFREESGDYALITASSRKNNPHSRIIWCCGWTEDSSYFATGSRDGKVCAWSAKKIEASPETLVPEATLDTQGQSVTALCFAPSRATQRPSYILAIGYDTGRIAIQMVTMNVENAWLKLIEYDTSQAHHSTVKRLVFRPSEEHSSNILQLASCGCDHAVKIHDIDASSLTTPIKT
ncbi:hypothetical protein DMN91_010223 [Ooceraea biroi]|uniref:Elongator complex protein 2 n=1 Tax=Ooceraea biroi TaxID=2015173 RepID=A0A026WK92_OOCBI|nr:elongator complex protein 2 [Ooceraea biroi]EZA56445.1 Elongator complex protein [Ooceraea biroi]RLU17982.1 hypothetical protein DMN91_010223 [Ooceraea biroi]